jgi:hypothetical protein
MAHFQIPLNLPHAGTISARLDHFTPEGSKANEIARKIAALLVPFRFAGENPPTAEADRVVTEAAKLGRELVDEIEREKCGHDRLGQAVRNLFECLELGEEGARISLRAGEDPKSALRPI